MGERIGLREGERDIIGALLPPDVVVIAALRRSIGCNFEGMMWIVRTGSQWRHLPPLQRNLIPLQARTAFHTRPIASHTIAEHFLAMRRSQNQAQHNSNLTSYFCFDKLVPCRALQGKSSVRHMNYHLGDQAGDTQLAHCLVWKRLFNTRPV